MAVNPPTAKFYKPKPLDTPSLLNDPCPFLDGTEPLCCTDCTAKVMQANFQALDAVFATDNPICAVNLKKMWCEYACNAEKINF
jgi:hypothetical protein